MQTQQERQKQHELELQELRERYMKLIQENAYNQGFRDGKKALEDELKDIYNEGYKKGYKDCENE